METILLSNIPHYHYLAQALERAGYLKRYITSVALGEETRIPGWVPGGIRKKLEGRRIPGVPGTKVRRILAPELAQRGATRLGLGAERGDWLNNHWFDARARASVDGCDVLHFVSSVGLYAARKARALGARIVCDVRQEHPAFQRRILEEENRAWGARSTITGASFEGKVLEEFELADYLVVPSEYAKESFVAEGFDASRIFVLPYGVSGAQFRKEGTGDGRFRALFVGQLTFRKGVQYLLQAFAAMRAPDAELVLIGTLDPAFKPVLEKYSGICRYLGPVPKVELYRHYSSASVLVLPSVADAFPLVVPEAMACGLPVLVSRNTGSREIVREGENGFVVPIRDPESIRERLESLRARPALVAEMGRAAARCAAGMTWARYGERAIEWYRTMGAVAAQC